MTAIIQGMENGMTQYLVSAGGIDKVRIRSQEVPIEQDHLKDHARGKTMDDVFALNASAPLIKVVAPAMEIEPVMVTHGDKRTRPSDCEGVWPETLSMENYQVEHGRFFNDLDQKYANIVCVIGTGIRDELFGSPENTGKTIIPIGEIVNVNNQAFTIIGIFKHYESEIEAKKREVDKMKETNKTGPERKTGWRSQRYDRYWRKNNMIYIPLKTAWVKFRNHTLADETNASSRRRGSSMGNSQLTDVDIKVADFRLLSPALQQARNILMRTHKGIEDFTFETREDMVLEVDTRIRNARLSGGVIAGISLIVGGIGIMNIMFASINERIREIGTCKALGAANGVIFLQILVEATTISMIGAAAGILTSFGLVDILERLSPTANTPEIKPMAALIAVCFSGFIGITAGVFPGLKAAKLDPIQALRFE
jgi:ABC-type antimicrobial peptide transport system permease subunit